MSKPDFLFIYFQALKILKTAISTDPCLIPSHHPISSSLNGKIHPVPHLLHFLARHSPAISRPHVSRTTHSHGTNIYILTGLTKFFQPLLQDQSSVPLPLSDPLLYYFDRMPWSRVTHPLWHGLLAFCHVSQALHGL